MLFNVICSPKMMQAKSITKMRLVPLNIYAVLISICLSICCHHIAYTPMTPIAPHSPKQYSIDKNSCCAANFVNSVTQAYSIFMPINAPYFAISFTATNDKSALLISSQIHSFRTNCRHSRSQLGSPHL